MAGEEGGVVEGGGGILFRDAEEVFHLASGGEGDEQVAGLFAGDGEGVGDVAGAEDGVAGMEGDALAGDLEKEFAFHDVKVLFLGVVEVQGRASAFAQAGVLDEEEVACGFAAQHFEGDGAEAEGVMFVEAVLPGGDDAGGQGGRRGRAWGGGEGAIDERGGEKSGGGLDEAAALQAGTCFAGEAKREWRQCSRVGSSQKPLAGQRECFDELAARAGALREGLKICSLLNNTI